MNRKYSLSSHMRTRWFFTVVMPLIMSFFRVIPRFHNFQPCEMVFWGSSEIKHVGLFGLPIDLYRASFGVDGYRHRLMTFVQG